MNTLRGLNSRTSCLGRQGLSALRHVSVFVCRQPFEYIKSLPNRTTGIQCRQLHIHEFSAFELMKRCGVSIPRHVVVRTSKEALEAFRSPELGGGAVSDVVVKAQVLTSGRSHGIFDTGFRSGIHVARNEEEVAYLAAKMLGNRLITEQTTMKGKPVHELLLVERLYLKREAYFSILMDSVTASLMLVGSPAGGVTIEEIAAKTPELILTERLDTEAGVTDEIATKFARHMGFEGEATAKCASLIMKLYGLFLKTDATLVEINPLVQAVEGGVFVCGGKLTFDDNAMLRQPEIHSLRDHRQEDALEKEAALHGLNYIGLDGNIGCLVNGAGLAMATMDIVKLYGGEPANFLDVGGAATEEQVQKGFEILCADEKVEVILVNIFGGITRCDVIAQGIVDAVCLSGLQKPVVIRIQGTKDKEAKEIISRCHRKMIMTDDLDDVAAKAVRVAEVVTASERVDLGVSFKMSV